LKRVHLRGDYSISGAAGSVAPIRGFVFDGSDETLGSFRLFGGQGTRP